MDKSFRFFRGATDDDFDDECLRMVDTLRSSRTRSDAMTIRTALHGATAITTRRGANEWAEHQMEASDRYLRAEPTRKFIPGIRPTKTKRELRAEAEKAFKSATVPIKRVGW